MTGERETRGEGREGIREEREKDSVGLVLAPSFLPRYLTVILF